VYVNIKVDVCVCTGRFTQGNKTLLLTCCISGVHAGFCDANAKMYKIVTM